MEEISDFIISLLPSSAVTFLIYLAGVSVLSVLAIFYFAKKYEKKEAPVKKELNIEDLINIAKNENSTLKDLKFTFEYFMNNLNIEDDLKKSFELFKLVLTHKNREKVLFDIFHGQILPANLKYKRELNKLEKDALNK